MLTRDEAGGGLVGVARYAMQQFQELTGLVPERITGAKRDGDGWSFIIDLVELERIPPTMSVLASYRLDTDRHGALTSYERLRRFTRVTTD